MKNLLPIVILIAIFLNYSCEDDEQDEISCATIVCEVGKTCLNSVCICADNRFEGRNCDVPKNPNNISIKSLELLYYPFTKDDGRPWDIGNGPDLYIRIDEFVTPIWQIPNVINNADSSRTILIPVSGAIINNIEALHDISLYDDDGNLTDEFMAGAQFRPFSKTTGFPKEIRVSTGPIVAYKLRLEYNFN